LTSIDDVSESLLHEQFVTVDGGPARINWKMQGCDWMPISFFAQHERLP
jgi:hypothetical protein